MSTRLLFLEMSTRLLSPSCALKTREVQEAARPLVLEMTTVGASIGMAVGAGSSTAVGVRVKRHCGRHE